MVDSLTLTVNSRLARWLQYHHGSQQAHAGLKVWGKPAIYSLDEWLQQAWLQSWPDEYVLSPLQSKHLWQKIIRENPATADLNLLHIQGAAALASEAYQLIRQYRLPEDPSQFTNYTEETRAFLQWMTRYRKQLKEWGALDPAELLDAISRRMEQGHIPIPDKIIFRGFDEITPQFNDWLIFLKNKNVSIDFEPFEPAPVTSESLQQLISEKSATVQKYEDANEEVIQCARWIRSIYKDGETIGVVIPKLEDYRDILQREFKAELAPASVYPWKDTHIPFNISLGLPLSHEPMIHLALLLLSQMSKRVPLLTFSTLITSPFLKCPPEEQPYRRELDWTLRGKKITHVFLPKALTPEEKKQSSSLVKFMDQLMSWVDDTSFRLPSEWARGISKFLNSLEWPNNLENLSSYQYQALQKWNECLDSLASLDRILQKIDRHHAVSHLTSIVEKTLFQAQTHEEPIQIVDLPESAGMEFDHLWIMCCDAETLPPIPSPNPFLPFNSHQAAHSLPHSTAERELAFTEQTLFRLAESCQHLTFSYPLWKKETELVPSPLITPWVSGEDMIHISKSNKLQDHPGFSTKLESIKEYFPIHVLPEENKWIKGGASIIKNQAECPFRAFAVHRLESKSRDFAELDVDESFRGSVIHKILELFWVDIQTSERLHELHNSQNLLPQIKKNVEEGLRSFELDIHEQNSFFELERERLTSLIYEWMECERERGMFKVLDLESEKILQLGKLSLTIKVDRIDQFDDGTMALIDYKTGAPSNANKWFGERIEDPQLPLYSLEVPADAIAFAQVRKGELRYRGLSSKADLIPRVDYYQKYKGTDAESWEEIKKYWQTQLTRTAGEFLEGHLNVDPIDPATTCRYCDQKTFCRKTELLNFTDEEAE
jgi:probable DNA repair protein